MNPDLSRVRSEWIRALALVWKGAANLVATLFLWLLMIGLLSCPVWLPLLVENLTSR